MNARKDEANWKVWIASTVYLGIFVAVVGPTTIFHFLTTTPELNQIGDFLAGLFAPLALIWLVVAVLTQRQELKETKKQFRDNIEENRKQFNDTIQETRDQFRAGQEVTQKQLALLDQANTNQHAQAARNYKLSLFDDRIDIYNMLIGLANTQHKTEYFFDYQEKLAITELRSRFLFDAAISGFIRELSVCFGTLARTEQTLNNFGRGTEPSQEEVILKRNRKINQEKLANMLNGDYLFHIFANYLTVTDVALEANANIQLESDTVVSAATTTDVRE